jgi:hypothetical protein
VRACTPCEPGTMNTSARTCTVANLVFAPAPALSSLSQCHLSACGSCPCFCRSGPSLCSPRPRTGVERHAAGAAAKRARRRTRRVA